MPSATSETAARFALVEACWICDARALRPVYEARFDFTEFREQDPALAAYTGETLPMRQCSGCGFVQPEALPTLDNYFGRMYDQQWSDEWMQREFASASKRMIFDQVLRVLERALPAGRRRLLDLGAHVGAFIARARARGWDASGVELNPRTAAFAARATGAEVLRVDASELSRGGARYDAITLIDVLEHIPLPRRTLATARELLAPGGHVVVKVPSGPSQRVKEEARARLRSNYCQRLANNLVHVSHFSPRSLELALRRSGYDAVRVLPAAPEFALSASAPWRERLAPTNVARRAFHAAVQLVPGGARLPICFNLLAVARRR
ncbi:MAG TPA: class I SAM-dependent methyltransferase [Vicinamibacterales bacterium]|nr:class I SAM-dependent methyltransferase [Vicinamibacterales bacterium]